MENSIDDAVGRCLEELGFKTPTHRKGHDADPSIEGDYLIIEVYPKNRQGVSVSRRTIGYKESSNEANGIYPFSKILEDVITFKVGDDGAGLTIFPEREDEKPIPYSNLKQLEIDLQNMFKNAWPTSDIGDYLRTVYHRLLKYA